MGAQRKLDVQTGGGVAAQPAGQLVDLREPVAQRVVVDEQLLGGPDAVALAAQEHLERVDERAVVVAVVLEQRPDRLGAVAAQLVERQPRQQAVDAELLVLEHEVAAAELAAEGPRRSRLLLAPPELVDAGGPTARRDHDPLGGAGAPERVVQVARDTPERRPRLDEHREARPQRPHDRPRPHRVLRGPDDAVLDPLAGDAYALARAVA